MDQRLAVCAAQRDEIVASVLADVREAMPKDLVARLSLETPLSDLGLDSIATMGVVNKVEGRFGFRIREEMLYEIETCGDLVDCIAEQIAPTTQAAVKFQVTVPPPPPPAPPQRSAVEIPREYVDVAQFPECVAFRERAAGIAAAGLHIPFFRTNEQVQGRVVTIAGHKSINFTSFDYLGLACDERVIASAKQALDRFGTSASASRLVGGNNTILDDLDRELADFIGAEAATVFASGYGTNASLFGNLFGQDDLILYDELAHNSIVQGAMLSKAARRSFPHNDAQALDDLLRDVRGSYRRVVVAIEGVYSMDGDFPDLPRFLEVKHRHGALLYVDEAHSLGVMGPTGRGICEHFGVRPSEGDLWMGTISKALASGGGYLAGRAELIDYLRFTTPSFVFATACSPANAAAALTALRVLRSEPQRVTRLHERSRLFLNLAHSHGWNTGGSQDTPIVPVILGNSARCLEVSHELLAKGVNAQPILYPAVREAAARVRFFITAEHTEQQIRQTIAAVAECLDANH